MAPDAKEFFDVGMAALARADLPACKAAFQRCVQLAPHSAEAWCYLGIGLSFKEPGPAAAALDRALALDPDHHGALYWRAEVYWIQGDASSAAKLLRHVNRLAPGAPQNLARLGYAHLAAGEIEAARAALIDAVWAGDGPGSVTGRQVELRRAIYLDLLGRRNDAVRLVQEVNGAGLGEGYSRERYPRDLEEQRQALEKVVAGRDIVVLGSGPSLATLEPQLASLGSEGCRNLCFFGFNNVPVAERMLIDTIGRGVDLACMTSVAVMELHAGWISEFLARKLTPSLFLTPADALKPGRPTAEMIAAQPQKLFCFAASGDHPPVPEDPLHFPPVNTLMCVLPLAILGLPRRIMMFGCDGAAPSAIENGGDVYFRQGSAEFGDQQVANDQYARWLARDTFFFNAMIPMVLYSLSVLHRAPLPPIYVCNPDSAYNSLSRIEASGLVSPPAITPGIPPNPGMTRTSRLAMQLGRLRRGLQRLRKH